jgi:integrase
MPRPAKERTRLTQRGAVKLATFKVDAERVVWDEHMPGLGIRLRPGRTAVWIIRGKGSDGRQHRRTIGTVVGPKAVSLDDARAEAGSRSKLLAPTPRTMSVSRLIDHYLENHRSRKKGRLAKEDRDVRRRVEVLRARWGKRPIDSITHVDVATLLQEITTEGLAAKPRKGKPKGSPYESNRMRALIRSIWNDARVWRFVSASLPNPTEGTHPNREHARDVPALGPAAVRRVLMSATAIEHRWAGAAIAVLVMTGARTNEILALRWDDVDLRAHTITLRDRKAGDDLVLPLATEAVKLLRTLSRVPGNPHVFPGPGRAGHLASIRRQWEAVCKDAELPARTRPHDLRGALATNVAARAGIKAAQNLLGHADPRTTLRYVRPTPEDQRRAVEAFVRAVAPKRRRKPKAVASAS